MTGVTPRSLAHLLDDPTHLPVAVADPDHEWSGDETRRRVDALVAVLHDGGVRRGDRVGVMLETGARAFVVVHAVLRAGGVVVPLDPRAPAERLLATAADAGAAVLVTDASSRRLAGLASRRWRTVVGPSEDDLGAPTVAWAEVDRAAGRDRVDIAPHDHAYLIYTSGSTGRPKGILHTHESGLAYARLAARTYALGPSDRVATLSPLHFDQSTFSLYAAPLAGSTALLVPDSVVRFPADLTAAVEALAATVWYSVPTLLLQVLERGVLDDRDLGALRWVLFGGELFPPERLAVLMDQLPGARFSNVYGPAEVNQCTFHHLDRPPAPTEPVPIGRAWEETEVRLLDEHGREVGDGAGAVGEIVVRSSTAMAGYWGDAELTRRAFRMLDDGTGPWYRTGDLATKDAAGDLVFLGRRDNQVKVRGHRVELEAVDAELMQLPGIEAAATVVRTDPSGLDELVAFVVARPGLDEREVRRRLAARLPAVAVPAALLAVDALPRTSTGKVDRPAVAAQLGAASPRNEAALATGGSP